MVSNQTLSSQKRLRHLASRFARGYKAFAVLIFNTIVIYVLLNLALGAVIGIRHAYRSLGSVPIDPITANYGADLLDKVYPGVARQPREMMLAECWNRHFVYTDFTHFKEQPWSGRYVNVTETGYRMSSDQGPWPPAPQNFNVFVFGGSTTFGYGQPDDLTLPSLLQEALARHSKRRVCVYNFGVGAYVSTQERIRFEQLLLQGYAPQAAFFIDGINDSNWLDGRPAYSNQMAKAIESIVGFDAAHQSPGSGTAPYLQRFVEVSFDRLPIGRLADYARRKLGVNNRRQESAPDAREGAKRDREVFLRACDRYLANKQLIEQCCKIYNVTPIFVWQPAPGYKYQLKYHLFAGPDTYQRQNEFYATMFEQLEQRAYDPHFIWCADIQEDATECLYCDRIHYTSGFMKTLADRVVSDCLGRKLLDEYLHLDTNRQ